MLLTFGFDSSGSGSSSGGGESSSSSSSSSGGRVVVGWRWYGGFGVDVGGGVRVVLVVVVG
jgi:hypothetical protein